MAVVRDAEASDVPAILEIYNEVLVSSAAIWRDEPESLAERQAWFGAKRADGWPVLVATDGPGHDVVGFASFGPFRAWPGYAPTVEHSIHVRAGRRGAGVGRALLEALADRARSMGKEVMVAGIDGGNDASIAFHEHLGFRVVAWMPAIGRKYGDAVDLVLMQRPLDGTPEPAAATVARELGLEPHPEGGWYRETHRSAPDPPGSRAAGTAIFFLVTHDSPSHLHRIDADEVFHHYAGDPVTQLVVAPSGGARVNRIGPVCGAQRPQAVVPAGAWQGCLVQRPGGWALLGCTVAPGFEFDGFELAAPAVVAGLVDDHPDHAGLLRRVAPDPPTG